MFELANPNKLRRLSPAAKTILLRDYGFEFVNDLRVVEPALSNRAIEFVRSNLSLSPRLYHVVGFSSWKVVREPAQTVLQARIDRESGHVLGVLIADGFVDGGPYVVTASWAVVASNRAVMQRSGERHVWFPPNQAWLFEVGRGAVWFKDRKNVESSGR